MKNSRSPVRPHTVFAALLFMLLLGACTQPAPTPQRARPPEPSPTLPEYLATASAYPRPDLPMPNPTSLASAYPPPPTLPPSPSPTFGPSPTPTPTPTLFPTYPAPPTLIPTLDPTTLPDQLRAALSLQTETGVNSHFLQKVKGWKYGMRLSDQCLGPFRWLDDGHLLLYPVTGEEEGIALLQYSLPVVMNLRDGKAWLPLPADIGYLCDMPLWSEKLQALIVTDAQGTRLLDAEGNVVRQFTGGARSAWPSSLSPSRQRLLTGFIWQDLETGQMVDFSGQSQRGMDVPSWSSNEKRLFSCCFIFADADTGQYRELQLDGLEPVGRDSCLPLTCLESRWVLDGTRVIVQWDFVSGAIPLIDPVAQTYEDLRTLTGLDIHLACGAPIVAPDGERIIVDCAAPLASVSLLSSAIPKAPSMHEILGGGPLGPQYLIDLRTFVTQTLPAGWEFVNWSPNSHFALLIGIDSRQYALLPIAGGDLYPVAKFPFTPVWSADGKYLAYLIEDGRGVVTFEPATHASRLTLLPQPSASVIWNPQGDSLAILADDGSLWWIPNPGADDVEQITLPLPDVRDVRWSPSGAHLAFISGTEVYVVRVTHN